MLKGQDVIGVLPSRLDLAQVRKKALITKLKAWYQKYQTPS